MREETMNGDGDRLNDGRVSGEAFPGRYGPSIAWDVSFPLVTNRFFLYDMIKVTFLSCLVLLLIFVLIIVTATSWDTFPSLLHIIAIFFVAFNALYFLVALVFFGNRYPARFVVSERGVSWETRSKRGKAANLSAVIIGVVARKPAVAGAGLLGMSGESDSMAWEDIKRVKTYPKANVITLMNSWRVVTRLYCSPDNFSKVLEKIRDHTGLPSLMGHSTK